MNVRKKQFDRWLEALYNQEFKKGKGSLQSKRGYCCLGVGCKLLIEEDRQTFDRDNRLDGTLPNDQRFAPLWLKNMDEHFEDIMGVGLAELNDGGGTDFNMKGLKAFSHPEIAILLDLVYNYKAINKDTSIPEFL